MTNDTADVGVVVTHTQTMRQSDRRHRATHQAQGGSGCPQAPIWGCLRGAAQGVALRTQFPGFPGHTAHPQPGSSCSSYFALHCPSLAPWSPVFSPRGPSVQSGVLPHTARRARSAISSLCLWRSVAHSKCVRLKAIRQVQERARAAGAPWGPQKENGHQGPERCEGLPVRQALST